MPRIFFVALLSFGIGIASSAANPADGIFLSHTLEPLFRSLDPGISRSMAVKLLESWRKVGRTGSSHYSIFPRSDNPDPGNRILVELWVKDFFDKGDYIRSELRLYVSDEKITCIEYVLRADRRKIDTQRKGECSWKAPKIR